MLVMGHFTSGPRGSEVPEVMPSLCIIAYTFTNLKKLCHIGRAHLTGSKDSSKERV